MSELKDRIKNDTDMSNTEVNAATNNVYRDDLEMAVFNARKRIEPLMVILILMKNIMTHR